MNKIRWFGEMKSVYMCVFACLRDKETWQAFHYANDIVKSSVSERDLSCYNNIRQVSF